MKRLTVIYYHDIVSDKKGDGYQKTDISKFEEQMKYLHINGINTISLDDLENGRLSDEDNVLVVFDDGFRSVYHNALPVMREYGIKGNVFVPTKYIEEEHPYFMSWEMLKRSGFGIGAHTHTHTDMRSMGDDEMGMEISWSNRLLKERLGIRTKSFCMPYGKYDKRVLKTIWNQNCYSYLFASYYGTVNMDEIGSNVLPRIGISNDDTLEIFEKKLKGGLDYKGFVQRARLLFANMRGERITQYDIE